MRRQLAVILAGSIITVGPALAVAVPAGASTSSSPGPTSTGPTTTTQRTGEEPTDLPDTHTCTETLASDVEFRNSAYNADPTPDGPYLAPYRPTCTAGSWSRIEVTLDGSVSGGTQFDRIGDVMVNGVELLHYTTPEGESGTSTWTASRDVTDDAAALAQPGQTYFQLGNQTDSTYTGIFHGSVTLTFYAADGAWPVAHVPSRVVPVGGHGSMDIDNITQPTGAITRRVRFPDNLTNLRAELFTSGHGGCEEDWWADPVVCPGEPYREVAVSIDGRTAGYAPVFPTLFTGGYGLDYWSPIPSPRTFDLRPYDVDLTAFVGELTDGEPHVVSARILGWSAKGDAEDHWPTALNLLEWTNPTSTGRTRGRVTAYDSTPAPAFDDPAAATEAAADLSATHDLTVTGTVHPAGGLAATVTTTERASASVDVTGVALPTPVTAGWTWDHGTTTRVGGHTDVDASHDSYSFDHSPATFSFADEADRTVSYDGHTVFVDDLADTMDTAASVVGTTGAGGASDESWHHADTYVGCLDHELRAAAGQVLTDTTGASCASGTSAPVRARADADGDGRADVDEVTDYPYTDPWQGEHLITVTAVRRDHFGVSRLHVHQRGHRVLLRVRVVDRGDKRLRLPLVGYQDGRVRRRLEVRMAPHSARRVSLAWRCGRATGRTFVVRADPAHRLPERRRSDDVVRRHVR